MVTSDDDSMENSRDDEVKDAPSQLDHSDSGMFLLVLHFLESISQARLGNAQESPIELQAYKNDSGNPYTTHQAQIPPSPPYFLFLFLCLF